MKYERKPDHFQRNMKVIHPLVAPAWQTPRFIQVTWGLLTCCCGLNVSMLHAQDAASTNSKPAAVVATTPAAGTNISQNTVVIASPATTLGVPVAERIARLQDPDVRLALLESSLSPAAGVFRRLADWGDYVIGDTYSKANEGLSGRVVRDIAEADVMVTLRTYYRSRQQTVVDAEKHGMPIYVLRANTAAQMESSLAEMFGVSLDPYPEKWEDVSAMTMEAIDKVLNGQRWVDMPAASSAIRRMQHELVREAQLVSHSYGKEPHRRVRIFREQP